MHIISTTIFNELLLYKSTCIYIFSCCCPRCRCVVSVFSHTMITITLFILPVLLSAHFGKVFFFSLSLSPFVSFCKQYQIASLPGPLHSAKNPILISLSRRINLGARLIRFVFSSVFTVRRRRLSLCLPLGSCTYTRTYRMVSFSFSFNL